MAPVSVRTTAERVARRLLHALPSRAVVPVVSGPLRGMWWVSGSAPHGAWLGRLERDTLEDFAAHIAADTVVWDVGANVGLYTLAAARRAAHVVAFEPASCNVAALRRHVALNGLTNVDIVSAAVASHEGTARLAAGASPSEFRLAGDGGEVPCVTLDGWRRGLAAPPPAVMKIDVEGAEMDVLDGAVDTITVARPRVYLAVHDGQHERCEERLRAWGYRLELAGGGRWRRDASEWIAVP